MAFNALMAAVKRTLNQQAMNINRQRPPEGSSLFVVAFVMRITGSVRFCLCKAVKIYIVYFYKIYNIHYTNYLIPQCIKYIGELRMLSLKCHHRNDFDKGRF